MRYMFIRKRFLQRQHFTWTRPHQYEPISLLVGKEILILIGYYFFLITAQGPAFEK